jgi:pimeloyl-ACP methyl ester carboxylesterase
MKPPTQVQIGRFALPGELATEAGGSGLVVFAHGSGSSRSSPRNRFVALHLQRHGLGTLLFDLLTEAEGTDRAKVFDIDLLAARLCEALDWIAAQAELAQMRIGLFGASTGAAAALQAASRRPKNVAAVVSRGGRPDLAMDVLPRVRAPTLLIVGGEDIEVLHLNRIALAALQCRKQLEIVPGATHLFEEPGTLAIAADLAANWFGELLGRAAP